MSALQPGHPRSRRLAILALGCIAAAYLAFLGYFLWQVVRAASGG